MPFLVSSLHTHTLFVRSVEHKSTLNCKLSRSKTIANCNRNRIVISMQWHSHTHRYINNAIQYFCNKFFHKLFARIFIGSQNLLRCKYGFYFFSKSWIRSVFFLCFISISEFFSVSKWNIPVKNIRNHCKRRNQYGWYSSDALFSTSCIQL